MPGPPVVAVGVKVEVLTGAPTVGVREGVGVFVITAGLVGVRVGVRVRVGVLVMDALVGEGVGVRDGVTVGPPVPSVMTNCGAAVPSLEENVTPSLPSARRANVYVPLPDMREVTSYSTQLSAAIAP